nr:Imm51 family immunity protein [uncultured Flavobacterium sp.]
MTVFIFSAFCWASCDQPNNHSNSDLDRADGKHETTDKFASILSDTTKPAIQKPMNKYYPFELQEIDGQYQIVANIEGKDLYPKYFDFFQEHGYEGNGYCWEGHITQILEKLDNKLLSQIDFDPEAGTFFANADSKEAQVKFVETLSGIFSDLKKLEDWVKKADRSRIDD